MSLIASALFAGARPHAEAAEVSRPNIVVFVTDDQPRELVTMPKTRSWFRAGGTDLPNAWATTPLCCPSRSSIFSGRYVHNTGVLTNSNTAQLDAFDQHATIQRLLHDSGYHTAMTGKYLNSWDITKPPPHFDRYSMQTSSTAFWNPKMNVDGTVRTVSGFEPDLVGDFANSYLDSFEADDASPWFLYVATNAPHSPYTAAPRYENAAVPGWNGDPAVFEADRSDKPPIVQKQTQTFAEGTSVREQQLRSLKAVDDMINSVMVHIQALGESNTLALFLADNGLMWGEHGVVAQKRLPYPQSAGVPMLMRWPGHVEAGAVDPRIAANVDLASTIADAAGITMHYRMDGESLLCPSARNALLLEYWRSPDADNWPSWAGLVTPTVQYTDWYRDDLTTRTFREYYDRTTDPWENQNLLADGDPTNHPDTAALEAALQAARTCVGSACVLNLGGNDLSPPTPPTALTTWERIDGVGLRWTAANDDVGVAAYDIYRDGSLVKSVGGAVTSTVDTGAPADVPSQYTVVARDAAGNTSGASDPVMGRAPPSGSLFVDAFETGTLGAWWSTGMSSVKNGAHSALWSARATSTGTPAYARTPLATSVGDGYVRAWIRIVARSSSTRTTLLRMVKPDGTSLMEVDVNPSGQIGYLANATNKWRWSSATLPSGVWTEVEVRTVVGAAGSVQLWVNGASVLSRSDNTGTAPIAKIQIGDNAKGRTYDVRFDDVVAAPSFVP